MFASLKTSLVRLSQATALLIFALSFSTVVFGQAQSNAADLQGFIKDTTGAVVPNATVTARNAATNVSRSTTSDDSGHYRIVNLPPNDYEITVEAQNFKKSVL